MKPIRAACSLSALALTSVLAADLSAAKIAEGDPVAWTEIDWPFLLDQWGAGHAFACRGTKCAPQDRLLLRVKSGFCNCGNSIEDDDEIDRLTDFQFLGGTVAPHGAGRPIAVAGVSGRLRAFAVETPGGQARHAVAVALARDCEAVVATLASDAPLDGEESAILASVGLRMIAALNAR
jgi:hypothetical protein